MAEFKQKFNIRTGQWNLVPNNIVLAFKAGVATYIDLPLTGNTKGDARIANDTGHLYVWSIDASSGLLTDWVDAGDIVDLNWDAISGKPSSTPADIDDAVSKRHTQNTDSYLATPVTKTFHVDKNRSDTYTENGSITKPYKTIQAAIDAIATLGLAEYMIVDIASGIYTENLVLENTGLKYIKLQGNGYVSINPVSGNALQSIANNDNLVAFYLDNIGFAKPVVLTGSNGASSFVDVLFTDISFTGTSSLIVTCINNISMKGVYSERPFTYVNVNWSNIQDSQLQDTFSFTSDSTQNIPSWGVNGTIQVFGSALLGAANYIIGGSATYTIAVIGSRWGSNSPITLPAGVTIYAYASFVRGTHTNNGSIVLRSSNIEGYVAGTGTLKITAQPASQINNDSTVTGVTVKDALETLDTGKSDKIRGTFVNGDLVAGKLTVTHNFGLTAPYVVSVLIFNNSNEQIVPDGVVGATNSVEIDLTSYGSLTGTYGYLVIA